MKPKSDTTLLRRAASVMRDRGNIGDVGNVESDAVERSDGGLTSGTGSLYQHLKIPDTAFLGNLACSLCCNLCCIGS